MEDFIHKVNSLLPPESLRSVDITEYSPHKVEEYLDALGWESNEDLESNGWDHDFWVTYTKGDYKLMFTGSWYYRKNTLVLEG